MCSKLCRVAGLLLVLLLAAIIGNFGLDIHEGHDIRYTNHDRSPEVLNSHRILWPKRMLLRHPGLLSFAKRLTRVSNPVKDISSADFYTTADVPTSAPYSRESPSPSPSPSPRQDRPIVAPSSQRSHNHSNSQPPSSPTPVPAALSPENNPIVPSPPINLSTPLDCRQKCPDGYTYTPPGAPTCGCVIPIQAQLRLGIKLEKLFPLVFELSRELAEGLFLQSSQVRIVGANAVDQSQEKTDVSMDFVPLNTAFDNTTVHLLASRFWSGQIPLNTTLFGVYSVNFVKYPGLPSSPPAQAPLGVSPSPGPFVVDLRDNGRKLSMGLIAVIILAAIMGILVFIGFTWLLLLRRSLQGKVPPSVVGPLHAYFGNKHQGIGLLSASMASSRTLSYVSSMPTCMGTAKTFTFAELERATDNFRPENIVGEGGFGRVYQGVLDNGCDVAVKVLTRDDQEGGREFVAEVEMLSRLHHRNLVKLIGICMEEYIRCLVYELITNGSVDSHLHGPDKYTAPLDWDARVKIALGAARGLAYLHEDSSPSVIHRDFKGSNILLEDDYSPKVSDFGLAKSAAEGGKEHVSTRVMGTFGYVAPEYAMTGHLLVKSDVYSYGVVLLELLSGRKPVDMSQPLGQENLVTWARPLLTNSDGLQLVADPALGNKFPFNSFARVAAIASMCVQPEVSHRPFMGEVVQALKLVYADSDACDSEHHSGHHQRGTSPTSDLVETQQSHFLTDESFISIDYDSGPLDDLEIEQHKPMSASAILLGSGRLFQQFSSSFRRHSSSGPPKVLSLPRAPWYAFRNPNSAGTRSEHGAAKYANSQSSFYGL